MIQHYYKTSIFLLSIICCVSCDKSTSGPPELHSPIVDMLREAARQQDTLMNAEKADSIIDLALGKALLKEDSALIAACYISALNYKSRSRLTIADGKTLLKQALNYADPNKHPHLSTEAYFAMCNFLLAKEQPADASVILGMATNLQTENKQNEVTRLLIQSKISQQQNQSFEQLKSLLDAQYIATDLENDSLQYASLQLLSDFYFTEGNYDQSLDYSQKIKTLLSRSKPVDSVKWYYTEANRLSVFVKTMDNPVVYVLAEKINDFAKRKNIPKLSSFAQSSLRSYFIEKKDFEHLKRWYSKYPDDLQLLREQNPSLFFRLKAYIAEVDSKKDSALIYFAMAGNIIEAENAYFKYNYYLRKSELEERSNKTTLAEQDLETAYKYSQQTKLFKEQIELGSRLADYYGKLGNTEKANYFLKTLSSSNSQYIKMLNDQSIKKIELNTIFAHKELERQKLIEKTERRHTMQYLIIALSIGFLIMSLITLSLYNVPRWWLKSMSFVSFVVLFEFIILLIDAKLHEIAHGDPYKILGVKVLVIPLLLPLHHWLEKKFVDVLLHRDVARFVCKLKRIVVRKSPAELHLGD